MEAVKILRQLWHYRLLLAIGILFATLIAILMTYKVTLGLPPGLESRQYKVGIASAEVLVDSPSSQIADIGGGQVSTDVTALTARARLLANLMATSPLKDQIARRAGVPRRELIANAPVIGPQLKPTPIDNQAAVDDRRGTTLTVYFNETLPIITADAKATTEEVAARISSAAIEELGKYLESVAASDKVPDARQLVLSPLGPARFATVQRGPRRLFSILAFVALLSFWCVGIVVVSRIARDWHEAAALEDDSHGSASAAARTSQVVAPLGERASPERVEVAAAASLSGKPPGPAARGDRASAVAGASRAP
jgi:hypothetical protein